MCEDSGKGKGGVSSRLWAECNNHSPSLLQGETVVIADGIGSIANVETVNEFKEPLCCNFVLGI